MTGQVSTILANAARRDNFFNKCAVIIRDIAGGHKFDDANKRTGQAVVEAFMSRNAVTNGPGPEKLRSVIKKVACGELKDVEAIASALRGY